MATTPPLMLQRPPAPPPDVTAQTGATPGPSASQTAASLQGGPGGPAPAPAGGANPAGAFLALADTIGRFIKQGAQMSDVYQPFADRMLAIHEAGTAEVTKAMPGAPQTPAPNSAPTGASGTEPQSASPAPKVGPGAPNFPG